MYFQNKNLFLLIFIFLTQALLFAPAISAQDSDAYYDKEIKVQKFDEKQWEGLVKDLDYKEKKYKEKKKEKESKRKESSDSSSGRLFNFSLGQGGMIFLYAIAAIVLIFIIVKLLGGNLFVSNPSAAKSQVHTIESLDEEIRESDLERFLREALSKQDYKLAVRIYYLMILKELTLRNWIDWRKEKTNREYILEMSGRSGFENFPGVTRVFEAAWYGEGEINADQYQQIVPPFQDFINSVKRTQA